MEKIKEKLKKYPIPLNCSNLSVAKCNAEIWGPLPHATKLQDISLQKNLNLISKTGAILANIGHHLVMWKAKETGENAFKLCSDFYYRCHRPSRACITRAPSVEKGQHQTQLALKRPTSI